jgi:hypothetical protein
MKPNKPKGKNVFGGGNEQSVYVPISELEQEALSRIVEDHKLEVRLKNWGTIDPVVTFGDLRVSLFLDITFQGPDVPVPVHFLDLELWTKTGIKLFGPDRQPLIYGGKPLLLGTGIQLQMFWDIALHHMSPELVKQIVPSAHGLTSRVLDKTTGKATLMGNMRLTEDKQKLLAFLRAQEAQQRQLSESMASKATAQEEAAVNRGEITRLV